MYLSVKRLKRGAIVENVTVFEALHQENEDVLSTTHLHTSQTSITLSFCHLQSLVRES